MKRLTATAMLLFLCSCDMRSTRKQPQAQKQPGEPALFRAPSATELFDLQSKCSAMGEKMLENNIIGNALTQDQISHYNPRDNRCYVKLTVSTTDFTTPREKFESTDYLHDGQSKELLAYMQYKGGNKSGMIYDSSLHKLMLAKNKLDTDADAISDLIDSFVSTDRRP